MGDVALVAHRVKDGKVVTVGLQLADEEVLPRWKRMAEWLRKLVD